MNHSPEKKWLHTYDSISIVLLKPIRSLVFLFLVSISNYQDNTNSRERPPRIEDKSYHDTVHWKKKSTWKKKTLKFSFSYHASVGKFEMCQNWICFHASGIISNATKCFEMVDALSYISGCLFTTLSTLGMIWWYSSCTLPTRKVDEVWQVFKKRSNTWSIICLWGR